MNQIKTLRKLAVLVLVLASVLTLAACKSGDKTPYGNISDDPYLTLGDITVTEKELYDQLRLQGASILATMVDETIFASRITEVKALILQGDEDLNDYLDDTINNAIHGSTNKESLEKLYTDNPERFARNIEQFVDSLYLLDNSVDIAAVKASIGALTVAYEGYSAIPSLMERYALRVTQRQYAKEILDAEVLDDKNTNYITEANLVTYYKNNMEGRYDVDALVIRFINLNEANAALYQASIKSDSRGLWYKIPDIRILEGNPGYIDLDDLSQTGYGHVRTILSDLGILGKLGADLEDRAQISVLDYENYYKRYVISTSRDTGLADEALTTAQVKAEFVKIYNILNPAAQVEVAVDGSIVGTLGSTFSSTFTYDDLTKLNTSLRSHVYTTLTAEKSLTDPNDLTTEKPFSSRVQTFGNSRYLVFKLSDEKASETGILVEDPADSAKQIFGDSQEALDIKAEVFKKLFDTKLSSTYISTKVNKLYEDMELNIYDKVVRIFYEQSYGYEGSTKNKSGNILADVDGKNITVEDFFNRLEKSYGINLALDIASNKYLLASADYTVSAKDLADYKKQFEDIISQFSANNFASSGFPASMGREKFLLLAFGSTTNTEAVNQLYVYPELRGQYMEDIEGHFSATNYTIYEKLADLAELQYNNFKSINVSHLLIYVDTNGDGSPDDPQKYLDSLGAAGAEQVLDGLVELVELLYNKVGDYKGFPEGLTALAAEFNNSGRILRGSVTPPFDYQIEQLWSKYRQLGFYLKYETLPSAITNTSNVITGQSVLDPVFYNRAMQLHAQLELIQDDASKFPLLDLYQTVITKNALDEVKSSFGWHLILATSVKKTTSAVFSAADDEEGKYVSSSDATLNVYNEDSLTLTASQIKFYLTEQKSDEGVVLPPVVQTAVSSYLTPVLTRYNNTYMQRELIFKLLADATYADANGAARFQVIRQINRRQLNEYLLSTTGVNDVNYGNLYGTWFTILESGL
ncbi:MAG: hypothetical protein Q7I99_00620 [Acholeplasmataceae bacterium]|nr:hypothetical protein [Acholeplasmataceae bacterium]